MTPSNQTSSSLPVNGTSTLMKHVNELEPGKKSRLNSPPFDVYPSTATSPTPMMMSSAYTPGTTGGFQPSTSTVYSPYAAGNAAYASVNQYIPGNGSPAMLNAPPTPQFVHSALGPPSPATALGSPFSTPQFSNASAYATHIPSPQLSAAPHQSARTVYIGNVPSDVSLSDLLDHIRSGNIDTVRPLPEKNCIFITFVEASAAAHFCHEATTKKLTVNGTELRIGWGRPSSIPANIHMAIQNGASRNVFLGSLTDTVTEQSIRDELSRFGEIEHIKLIRHKQIAFVHFMSTSSAIKCVSTLPSEEGWASRRVNYGRDRCCPANTSGVNLYLPQPIYPSSGYQNPAFQVRFPSMPYDPYVAMEPYNGNAAALPVSAPTMDMDSMLTGVANRTVYLGNIHPDTTCEEICNVIRGGILSQIRYLPDKHIAFVTFVDPNLSLLFHNNAVCQGLAIKNRRLKIGWGKASALSPAVIVAVRNGGSRNVYLGNIDDTITEEKLKQDFSDFGEIELVNTLKEKNCAFVNFTSIAAAVRAIEGIRSKEEYKKFRVNYGKDRCGNAPRMSRTARSSPVPNPASAMPLQPSVLMGIPTVDTQDFGDPTPPIGSPDVGQDGMHGVLGTVLSPAL